MKKEDSFLKRLHPVKDLPKILDRRNRFARDEKTADKTLGFIVVRLKSTNIDQLLSGNSTYYFIKRFALKPLCI